MKDANETWCQMLRNKQFLFHANVREQGQSSKVIIDMKYNGYAWHQKEGRKEGTCLFDINIKHNTEIFIGKIISGDSH